MKTVKAITPELQIASLRLFHMAQTFSSRNTTKLSEILKYGIIPVNANGAMAELNSDVASIIIDTLGIKGLEWSQSFHKSWDKVATAPIEQLVAEQIVNYFSTYGMESLGLNSFNWTPAEEVIADFEKLPVNAFTIVRIVNEKELKAEMGDFLVKTKAPHRDNIPYIKTLMPLVSDIRIDNIKSYELKIMFCELFDRVPVEGQDFLRYLIYKASDKTITTIVKDNRTIEMLKRYALNREAVHYFELADLEVLAETFYRFKPLYLAFKANDDLAPIINKIRRLATKKHKPLVDLSIGNVMNYAIKGDYETAAKIINKADNRQLVKLINFTNTGRNEVYNIRNGKMYVIEDDRPITNNRLVAIKIVKGLCLDALKNNLKEIFKDKVFYIPSYIKYAAPISEKQMMDVFPFGSKVSLPEDAEAICAGIHWFNDEAFGRGDGRIDLDLHLISPNGSYGWNCGYKNDNNEILFSGDMTDAPAPLGAVEAFRISKTVDTPYNLSINVYNASGNIPYDLLFTKDVTSKCDFKADNKNMISAVCEPSNALIPPIHLHTGGKDSIIGFYNNKSFTFYGGGVGNGSVPKEELMNKALESMLIRCDAMLDIRAIIKLGGGVTVSEIAPETTEFIDLSTDKLTISTLFDVVDGNIDKLPLTVLKTEEESE